MPKSVPQRLNSEMNVLQFLPLFSLLFYLNLPSELNGQQTQATKYFLNKTQIQIKPFSLQTARNGQLITSNMERFRDLYASTKLVLTQLYNSDYNTNYKYIFDTGRVQQRIRPDVPFPCGKNNTRSPEPPSSVHRLRPGDIDIVGAMGDSLTAGTGMMSKTFQQIIIEFRGQTTLGGGLKDWRTFLTLPNVLKVFNPNLYGYSIANTLAKFRPARFNVAEPFALSQDMPYMAEVLVKRMKSDPKVNMTQHWKMISIFVGANDICSDMCHYDKMEDFLESHRKDIYRTLSILRDNIPRLIVNIIPIPEISTILSTLNRISPQCITLHKFSCHCLIGNSINSRQLKARQKILKRFQQIDIEIASLPEFQLEEFAVVPQTLLVNQSLRTLKNGATDMRYFAIDCFHFSQYGNAAFTNMLWNNMLQVKTNPTTSLLRPFEVFSCPSEEQPYLRTLKNS